MNIFLDDTLCRKKLYPFTYTRHVSDIRVGIFTIKEKWALLTQAAIFTNAAMAPKDAIQVDANLLPTAKNFLSILHGIASDVKCLNNPWDIYKLNDWAIREDMHLINPPNPGADMLAANQFINPQQVFIEDSAQVNFCLINASAGPVYIGKNAAVMEGCMLRGPIAICDNALVKMGAKIYGGTTIGPNCVAGGEIKNAVFFAHSNKAHDGYLGDSVIGECCNLGAGTSNSNVKNNASAVKYFSGKNDAGIVAGTKAGLLMGDYSRCAINTSFNTGTIVGVCCNIFGNEMPAKYSGNFLWGKERYIFEKAIADIDNWKKLKGGQITENEISLLKQLYHQQ